MCMCPYNSIDFGYNLLLIHISNTFIFLLRCKTSLNDISSLIVNRNLMAVLFKMVYLYHMQ
jgi:hypothetical protein